MYNGGMAEYHCRRLIFGLILSFACAGDDDSGKNRPKKFLQVHSNPSIYLIRNFLSNSQMEYFDKMCTEYDPKFKTSFTGTDSDEEVISSERTSKFISLSKAQDKFVRDIEEKSAGLVGTTNVCLLLHSLSFRVCSLLPFSPIIRSEPGECGAAADCVIRSGSAFQPAP